MKGTPEITGCLFRNWPWAIGNIVGDRYHFKSNAECPDKALKSIMKGASLTAMFQ